VAEPLRLSIVGCAAAYSFRPWPSSAYLVERGDDAVLLDLGHGAFAALCGRREPSTLSAMFVSHLHPDHHGDLVPLRHYLKFGRGGARVPLHGPADIRAKYDAFLGEPDFLDDLPGGPLETGSVAVGRLTVDVARVTHTDSSFGFRVAPDVGAGLVYSGDCGVVDEVVHLQRSGDTLLCEASFGEGEPIDGVAHLTARQAGEAARGGGAARLVLTHILPEADLDASRRAAVAEFDGEVLVAEPGMLLEI
jgi:ribonuclease BN (tRNA processing enzyme)